MIWRWVKKKHKEIMLYMAFALVLIGVIASKENYFIDEMYSYGLANHVLEDDSMIWMQPKLAPYTYSSGGEPYYDYLTVKEDNRFHFANVWKNQANDTHPPFYYLLIHVVCSLFPGRFTKWQAGMINIVFCLLTLLGVRCLSKEFGCDEKDTDLISILFVFSTGILGAASYLRMYVMSMCEVTWFTWVILRWRGREDRRFYLLVAALSVVGVLTHYYFLLYLFFISLLYGISLLFEKAYGRALRYCGTMICAGVMSCLIFPAMINHIFGGKGRGGESFSHLYDGLDRYILFLEQIFRNINNLLFGGTLGIVLVIFMLYLCKKLRGGGKSVDKNRFLEMASSRRCSGLLPFSCC